MLTSTALVLLMIPGVGYVLIQLDQSTVPVRLTSVLASSTRDLREGNPRSL